MKRLFLVLLVSFLTMGIVYSAGIKVTSPVAGTTWFKGYSHEIKWSKLPSCTSTSTTVKINIFKNPVSQENFTGVQLIAPLADGHKSWVIPANFENGNYVIRVKTDDSTCFGDSGVFTIGTRMPTFGSIKLKGRQYLLMQPDLEIKILMFPKSPEIFEEALIEFKVKNVGNAISAPTRLISFKGSNNIATWNVPSLKPGRFFYKTKKIAPDRPGFILWSAYVDKTNSIGDTHRSNNHDLKKMIIKGPDLKITKIKSPDYKKTIQQKCIIDVTVTNIGHADAGNFELDCEWKDCKLIAQGRHYRIFKGILKPGKSVTYRFTHKYACFGFYNPKLQVDRFNKVKEENEFNNICKTAFHIDGSNIFVGKHPFEIHCNN